MTLVALLMNDDGKPAYDTLHEDIPLLFHYVHDFITPTLNWSHRRRFTLDVENSDSLSTQFSCPHIFWSRLSP